VLFIFICIGIALYVHKKIKGEGDFMLSDRDLRRLAEEKDMINPFNPSNCEGATINLTLNPKIKKYISDEQIIMGKQVNEDQYEKIDISERDFFIKSGESVLVQCNEYFKIPTNLAAIILERYSIKLLGLMISPASYMNPGYEGTMSFVAVNHSPVPIQLIPGVKFCQLALLELSSEPEKPYRKQEAKYLESTDVSISKLHLDKEIQEFLKERGIEKVSQEMATDLGVYLMNQELYLISLLYPFF